jgi:hypothetical protein
MLSSMVNADEEEENHGPIDYVVTSEAWFDIVIKETKDSNEVLRKGRVVIGLFGDICPMTTTNFIQLAKGFKREGVSFLKLVLVFISKLIVSFFCSINNKIVQILV